MCLVLQFILYYKSLMLNWKITFRFNTTLVYLSVTTSYLCPSTLETLSYAGTGDQRACGKGVLTQLGLQIGQASIRYIEGREHLR